MDREFIRCSTCHNLMPKDATRCVMCRSAVDLTKSKPVVFESQIGSPEDRSQIEKKFKKKHLVANIIWIAMTGFYLIWIISKNFF